jgi:hypothetical protein
VIPKLEEPNGSDSGDVDEDISSDVDSSTDSGEVDSDIGGDVENSTGSNEEDSDISGDEESSTGDEDVDSDNSDVNSDEQGSMDIVIDSNTSEMIADLMAGCQAVIGVPMIGIAVLTFGGLLLKRKNDEE